MINAKITIKSGLNTIQQQNKLLHTLESARRRRVSEMRNSPKGGGLYWKVGRGWKKGDLAEKEKRAANDNTPK